MIQFTLHTLKTAPAASKGLLEQASTAHPQLPNLFRTIAESPSALLAFEQLHNAFASSTLTPVEQEIVYLSVAQANACHYCTSQTGTFDKSEESRSAAEAIRAEQPIGEPKLQALRRFTTAMTTQRGWVKEAVIEDFLAAGYKPAQILEVISGLALGTISSYTNHIAATPIDAPSVRPSLNA